MNLSLLCTKERIILNKHCDNVFFSFLFKNKLTPELFPVTRQMQIARLSAKFLCGAILLKTNQFDESNSYLIKKLELERKLMIMKQIQTMSDLTNIKNILSLHKVEFFILKGAALVLNQICSASLRGFRDVDLLIQQDEVTYVYILMKQIGFRYMDHTIPDRALPSLTYRHLPAMINDQGTVVEIHWRVTRGQFFTRCPIAQQIFYEGHKQNSQFLPSLPMLVSHIIYHSFRHHKLSNGPFFLYDLIEIFKFNKHKLPVNEDLIRMLNLDTEFELCLELISTTVYEDKFTKKSRELLDNAYFNKLNDYSENNVSSMWDLEKLELKKDQQPLYNFFNKLAVRVGSVRANTQKSYMSLNFWLTLAYRLYKKIKIFNNFN